MNIYGDWFWPWWFQLVVYNHETGTLGFPIILIINYWTLLFCVRFVFQISPKDHGLQRRGFFHLMDLVQFIFYILNALLGLVKRAITSMVLQAVFVSRMDKSLMPRKYELKDKSYVAYLGFMQLDFYYSHPVFLTAVYFFLAGEPTTGRRGRRGKRRFWRYRGKMISEYSGDENMDNCRKDGPRKNTPIPKLNGSNLGSRCEPSLNNYVPLQRCTLSQVTSHEIVYSRRIRNRYWLAITLSNNPNLHKDRGHAIRARLEAEAANACVSSSFRRRNYSLHGIAQRMSTLSAQALHAISPASRYHAMRSETFGPSHQNETVTFEKDQSNLSNQDKLKIDRRRISNVWIDNDLTVLNLEDKTGHYDRLIGLESSQHSDHLRKETINIAPQDIELYSSSVSGSDRSSNEKAWFQNDHNHHSASISSFQHEQHQKRKQTEQKTHENQLILKTLDTSSSNA